jgi:energy-coupling factor transport system permease protein
MRYVRRASPLHAARAAAGALWCCAAGAAALTAQHPVVLCALTAAILASACASGVGREVARIGAWMAPWALVIALINVLVVREGLTVIARLGGVPPFGQIDLTLEGLVYGLMFGLRLLTVTLAFSLFACAVDPDDLLRGMRRLSLRSALGATLAVRLVPVLAADARRIDEARRCRPDGGGGGVRARMALLRSVASNALDRALDVAATLEVRGFGAARSRARPGSDAYRSLRPWSRHDIAFAVSALAVAGIAVAAGLTGFGGFETYPLLDGAPPAQVLALAGALVAALLLPHIDRRGVEP